MLAQLFDRQIVLRLAEQDMAQLVEALPYESYEQAHLPGALHVGLRDLDEEAPRRPGLRREGQASAAALAGDVADRNVPLCTVAQPLDDAVDMLDEAGRRVAVVGGEKEVIVGLLHHKDAVAGSGGSVGDAMRPGPMTVPADEPEVTAD